MEIVQVDVFALQVDQRLLALVADVGRLVRIFGSSREMADFGGDDELGALEPKLVQHARQHALGLAVAVDVGVVEVIHALVDAELDRGGDFVFIHVRPAVGRAVDPVQAAHRPAAQADFRDLHVGGSEISVLHGGFSVMIRKLYGRTIQISMAGSYRFARIALELGAARIDCTGDTANASVDQHRRISSRLSESHRAADTLAPGARGSLDYPGPAD